MFTVNVRKIDSTVHTNEGSFLQTPFWCEFKSRHGWSYNRFELNILYPDNSQITEQEEKDCHHKDFFNNKENEKNVEVAVLSRNFAKGLFSIAYIPLFPQLPYKCTADSLLDTAFLEEGTSVISEEIITPETQAIEFTHLIYDIAKALKPFLPENTICIRFDPSVDFSEIDDRDLFNYGMKTIAFADRLKLKKNKVDIQPPDTTLVDLTCSEENILSKMHAKWRYNIRLASKKGVTVHRYTGSDENIGEKINKFYELTKETNARDGNSSHAKSYYEDLIRSSAKELSEGKDVPVISLYIAEHEGDEIASIMTLFSKTESIYLYGASSNNKRNLMPNHLLQWTAIKDAKTYGSQYYDMYGMPPEGKDEHHPMHGLYMFKANFGGKLIHRTGSWDVPLKPVYIFYSTAEKLRAFWHKKVIKKLKGR
ncbi:MAG: peptidoglycan bridge formation glycyltransferase FemA/FemB family protein [Treponema sp.]|nr:peptidoglycan bridge formation glycyltransferase FemA/FemB family protein [Treponema sp.]